MNNNGNPQGKIGRAIGRLRREEGWSQQELAALVGITQPYVSAIEQGKAQNLSLDLVDRLSAAFGVSVEEMMVEQVEIEETGAAVALLAKYYGDAAYAMSDPAFRRIAQIYAGLGPGHCRKLCSLVEALAAGGWFGEEDSEWD